MLVTFLESSEFFLQECSNDSPDDPMFLIDAARELTHRSPSEIPPAFEDVINRILRKEFLPEWHNEESDVGSVFRRQLALLLQQEQAAFANVDHALAMREIDTEDEERLIEGEEQEEVIAAVERNKVMESLGEDKVIEATGEVAVDGDNQ
jgi:hypothetical protein